MRRTIRFVVTLVGMLLITHSSNPLHPDEPVSIAQANNSNCRLMPLGNSITVGIGSGELGQNGQIIPKTQTGYRLPLWKSLGMDTETKDIQIDYVGSESAGGNFGQGLTPPFDPDHAGFPGIRDFQLLTLLKDGKNRGNSRTDPPGRRYLVQFPADIILLHIGTNHVNASTAANVEAILDEIFKDLPNASIILARIINRKCGLNEGCMTRVPRTKTFNQEVQAMVTHRRKASNSKEVAGHFVRDQKVVMVDMEKDATLNYGEPANTIVYAENKDEQGNPSPLSIPTGDHFADSLHPNQSGYDKMALVWLEALKKEDLLKNCSIGTIPSDTTPPAAPLELEIR